MDHPSAEAKRAKGGAQRGNSAAADEIAHFDRIAADWWDPAGKFRPLHQLNPLRLAYIEEQLRAVCGDGGPEAPLAGLAVLDVGCGGGLVAEGLARRGARVLGIDPSSTSVAVARHHAQESGVAVDYECAVPEDLVAAGRTFDAVVAMEVVEHVADLDGFLRAIATLTRPGGAVVLATLNRTLKSLLLAKVGAEYLLRWVPAGTHDWRKFIRPHELARAIARHRLTMTDARGVSFEPLSRRWAFSRDLSVNYLCSAAKS